MNKLLSRLEYSSLLFILTSGLTTFLWFVLYLLGFGFSITSLLVALLTAVILSSILIKTSKLVVVVEDKQKFSAAEKYIIGFITVLILLATLVAAYNPVVSWDSLTLYDFRGLIIAHSHSLQDISSNTYYLGYPLMTSLVHAAFYMVGSNSPQIFYALLYTNLIGLAYGRVRSWTSRSYALIAALLVAYNPFLWEHATISYTNLPYSVFLLAGLLYAPNSLLLSGVLIGLSTWVRMSEPFWIVGLLLIAYYGYKQKNIIKAGLGIIAALVIRTTWTMYLTGAYLRAGLVKEAAGSIYNLAIFGKILANFGTICSYLWEFIITPYFGIWILAIFSLVPAFIFRSKLYLSFIMLIAMTVAGTAIFSTYFASWYSIGGSATRMILFIAPLITMIGVRLYYLSEVKHGK